MVLVIAGLVGAYYLGRGTSQPQNPVITNQTPQLTPSPTSTKQETGSGTVMGKLCYPSEFLPVGKIIAKDINSGKIFTQDYPGSDNVSKNTFSLELSIGKYYLRYDAYPSGLQGPFLSGYHTVNCPSGTGPNCSQNVPRVLDPVEVNTGKVVKNIDLCDFYYPPDNEPKF